MTFEAALRQQLESTPDLKRRGKKILAILNGRPSKRRTRQLRRMESHVRAEIGMNDGMAIDWSAIDWPSLIGTILKLLLALLPFLI